MTVPGSGSPAPVSGPGSCNLESRATSAKHLESQEEWQASLEWVWRTGSRPRVDAWNRRARREKRAARGVAADDHEGRAAARRRSEYAAARARALSMPRADVVGLCRQRFIRVACGCGWRDAVVGCGQVALCGWCRRRHWRRWRRRITRAVSMHLDAARAAWRAAGSRGKRPRVYLVTLTGPAVGTLEERRAALARGLRALTNAASRGRWWSTYCAVWELTPGADGVGHPHLHVVAVSRWLPYEELHRVWRAAVPGALVLNVQTRDDRGAASAAGNYASKYVTKGTLHGELTGQTAGRWMVVCYGKRRVTCARHFWRPSAVKGCRHCGGCVRLVAAPAGLAQLAAGKWLRAMAEVMGVWLTRGTSQTMLPCDVGPPPRPPELVLHEGARPDDRRRPVGPVPAPPATWSTSPCWPDR